MDRLGLDQVDLVGCSIGGWIAAEMATKTPERFRKLVLVGPVGVKLGPADKLDIPDIFAMPQEHVNKLAVPRSGEMTFRSVANFPTTSSPSFRATARRWRCWSGSRGCTIPSSSIACIGVAAPTLFLRGESDGLVSADYLDALCAAAAERAHRDHRRCRPRRPGRSSLAASLRFLDA